VQDKGAALLLDGHPDLVARGGADGAHLAGIEAFNAALEQLKPERIAGIGGLTSRHDAMVAAEASADYLMFGGTGIAPAATMERVGWAAELFELPCVGFANEMNEIAPLVAAGADFIAVDFIWNDPRGSAAAVAEIAQHLRLLEPVSWADRCTRSAHGACSTGAGATRQAGAKNRQCIRRLSARSFSHRAQGGE
jgi:thiamine-phosphate pyrophosphorylase